MSANVPIVLLGAGRGTRMRGRDKLLEPVEGRPLLVHLARQALQSEAPQTIVVLPSSSPAREAALDGLDLRIVHAPANDVSMSRSLKAGIGAAGPCDGALILLGDMPLITTAHINALLSAFRGPGMILRGATGDGAPGHPVLFGRDYFPQICALEGDQGARDLMKSQKANVRLVGLPGEAAAIDLDTPEDWARWRSRTMP